MKLATMTTDQLGQTIATALAQVGLSARVQVEAGVLCTYATVTNPTPASGDGAEDVPAAMWTLTERLGDHGVAAQYVQPTSAVTAVVAAAKGHR